MRNETIIMLTGLSLAACTVAEPPEAALGGDEQASTRGEWEENRGSSDGWFIDCNWTQTWRGEVCFDWGDEFACGVRSCVEEGDEQKLSLDLGGAIRGIGGGVSASTTFTAKSQWCETCGACEECGFELCFPRSSITPKSCTCRFLWRSWECNETDMELGDNPGFRTRREENCDCPGCGDAGADAGEMADAGTSDSSDAGSTSSSDAGTDAATSGDGGVRAREDSDTSSRSFMVQLPDFFPNDPSHAIGQHASSFAELNETQRCFLRDAMGDLRRAGYDTLVVHDADGTPNFLDPGDPAAVGCDAR